MKGKNLQPRRHYPARLSFRFDGETKSFPDKQKVKRIQHHQTSFTINAKGNFSRQETREGKDRNKTKKIQKMNPKPLRKQ